MTRFAIAFLLLCVLSGALWAADEPAAAIAERARIGAERSRIESEFQAQRKACYARFAVTGCIEDAKSSRNALLGELRRQEIALNDAQRKARSADRVKELERKQDDQARKQAGSAADGQERRAGREQRVADKEARARSVAGKAGSRPGDLPTPRGHAARGTTVPRLPRTPPQPDAADNRRRYDQRQQDAQTHKASVQERAAEQKKKPVDPLPVPP
ncbi:MAG: hypothetical protein NVS2B4_11860 [Ramlibacter sp.]